MYRYVVMLSYEINYFLPYIFTYYTVQHKVVVSSWAG